MTKQKQALANRTNAQKSTGPITTTGKAIVAKNALKHAILSNEVVLKAGDIKERKKDFEELKTRLIEDLQPTGVLEEMLVDKIASTYWRLRRVIKAESGEIIKQTNNFWFKRSLERGKEADEFDKYPSLISFKHQKLRNSFSASRAKTQLEGFKESVEKDGHLSEEALNDYAKLTNLVDDETNFKWVWFFNDTALGKVEGEEKEKGKKALLYILNKDIEFTRLSIDITEELEKTDDDAKALTLSIPPAEAIDRITRYETTLENQLYKAINQLLKLQSLRKGGRVISARLAEFESIET